MASPTLQFKRGAFVNLPGLRAGEPGFTTDKYDLYVGLSSSTETNKFFGSSRYWTRENGTDAAQLKLVDRDGTNGVSLRAPATVATPVTYTLPEGGGTQGHFLKLGASGVLEWASATSGVSYTDAQFTGVSTFSGLIDANGGLDVAGHAEFDDINVTGIATIATAEITAAYISGGSIDGTVIGGSSAAAGTFTELAYDNSSTSGISTVGSLYVGPDKVLSNEGGNLTLSGIEALDATTKATLESQLQLDPNNFDSLNVTGISTFGALVDANAGLDVTGHTELDSLNVTGVATFTSAIDADLLGNAGTATSLATARNFDISGSFITASAVSFDGTGNVSLAATITANSIELGTYTSGDYVADVSGTANQISVTGTGEGASVVLSLPNDVVVGTSLSVPTVKTATVQHSNGTEAITIDAGGNVGVSTNLTVSGNLFVNGTTTQVNTTSLTVEDTLVELGMVDGVAPAADLNKDLGVVFNYYDGSAKKAAVYWDDSEARIAFASEATEAASVMTAVSYATILAGGLEINNACTGGTDTVISCVNSELALSNIVVDGGVF